MILPEASLEAARIRAEQLRRTASECQIQHRGSKLERVTVSVGVACYPEHGATGEALLRSSDEALYRAKQEGRDRVIVA